MEIVFDAHGNEKQLEAIKYWIDPNITDIVYGGSKGSGKSYLSNILNEFKCTKGG